MSSPVFDGERYITLNTEWQLAMSAMVAIFSVYPRVAISKRAMKVRALPLMSISGGSGAVVPQISTISGSVLAAFSLHIPAGVS